MKNNEDCMETCNGEPCPNGMECEPHPDDLDGLQADSPLTKAWNAGYKQGQEDSKKASDDEWSEPQHCGGCEEVVKKQGPRVYFNEK